MYEKIYRKLYLIRRVEEEVARVYPSDKIKSPIHLSIGQEAVAVGVCEALNPDDIVFGSYRGHALYIAKGGDLKLLIAEMYGKVTGCGKGKGGSMHLIDVAHGIMGASAVVGTTIPNAVGYSQALKIQGKNNLVVSFFGDGATDEGVFYESLNYAALKKVPIIFICENNQYAIHTHQKSRQSNPDITGKASSFGIPARRIEDDVFKVYEAVKEAVTAIHASKGGPFFFECMTYRWKEHVGPNEDYQLGYRTREDAEPWIKNDQVKRVSGLLETAVRQKIESEVNAEIEAAFAYAEESPFPAADELYQDVFKD
jgi:TPP-dependent pyruvate/acetoin dehydrogenase alpha subunit